MPGVSIKIICALGRFLIPIILFLVVCGFGVTIAIFSPKIEFRSVDLPTFGRPIIDT
jgi:hypothetical protein